ncbi:hypothetical protein BpHYR1_045907 [Brachionus plicatilis]|uniref:Uncharacterized protein n=1 Tax=Brachionus plicatilis TaxID=10195 RepID=A0A3M7S7A0_BRAPC|nr:hypothetical protein BpHYR1_045907 [Brachionus plicatilis]
MLAFCDCKWTPLIMRFCLIDKVTTQLVNSIDKAPIADIVDLSIPTIIYLLLLIIPEKNRFLIFNVRDLLMKMKHLLAIPKLRIL